VTVSFLRRILRDEVVHAIKHKDNSYGKLQWVCVAVINYDMKMGHTFDI